MSDKQKQKFFAYAVPCDKTFVVASEKAEEFRNLKPNPELRRKIDEATKKLTNLKIDLEPIEMEPIGLTLKKVIKNDKK